MNQINFQKMGRGLVVAFMSAIFLMPPLFAENKKGYIESDGFFLPIGDAKEGRKAFVKLKCMACHSVHYESELPKPIAVRPGPVLGLPSSMHMPGELADAIVSPSHDVIAGFDTKTEGGTLSRMGDFSETMTVKQLVDIVAYLMSQEE